MTKIKMEVSKGDKYFLKLMAKIASVSTVSMRYK